MFTVIASSILLEPIGVRWAFQSPNLQAPTRSLVSKIDLINESTVYCLLGYVAAVSGVYEIPHGNSHYVPYVVSLVEPKKLRESSIRFFCLKYSDFNIHPPPRCKP